MAGKTLTNLRYITDQDITDYPCEIYIKNEASNEAKAEFTDSKTLAVSGLPEDIVNATAVVYFYDAQAEDAAAPVMLAGTAEEGTSHGQTVYSYSGHVAIENGSVALENEAVDGTEYMVVIKSDNYIDITTAATYTAQSSDDNDKPSGGKTSGKTKDTEPAADPADNTGSDPQEKAYDLTGNATRGLLVQMLYDLSGETASGEAPFTDLSGKPYRDAVIWAAQKGITAGVSKDLFGGDSAVTREQMVTMFCLYAQLAGKDMSADGAIAFADADQISSYARAAVDWASAKGLVIGVGHNCFDPQGIATGEQLGIVLKNFKALL